MLRIFAEVNDKNPLPETCIPVTIDVVSLYTNITADGPDGGLQAFEKALNQRADQSVPTDYIMSLMRMVLGGNIFSFNGRLYTQRIGTAMGTRVAPTYACIFMAWLETELLAKWTGTKPILFKRLLMIY